MCGVLWVAGQGAAMGVSGWRIPCRRELLQLVSGGMSTCGLSKVAEASPDSTRVGRGMRAVGTPNADGVDIDAALGIAWGGKRRCDAADPACSTNGAILSDVQVPPPPQIEGATVTAVAELEVSIAARLEGTLQVGLFGEQAPVVTSMFADLAAGTFQSDPDCEPTGLVEGGSEITIRAPYVIIAAPPELQEIALRRRLGLRKTPEDFVAAKPPKLIDVPILTANTAGVLSTKKAGPGDRLEFAIQFEPATKKSSDRLVLGALMDEDSMRLLRRLATVPVVAERAALGGKAGKPIVKVSILRTSILTQQSDTT